MREIFADTGYWIAIPNPADDLHQRALEVTGRVFPVQVVTTEFVPVELLNGFSGRGDRLRGAAVRMVDGILADSTVEVLATTTDLFQAGLRLYGERLD